MKKVLKNTYREHLKTEKLFAYETNCECETGARPEAKPRGKECAKFGNLSFPT